MFVFGILGIHPNVGKTTLKKINKTIRVKPQKFIQDA